MYCTRCGAMLDTDSDVCSKCQSAQAQIPDSTLGLSGSVNRSAATGSTRSSIFGLSERAAVTHLPEPSGETGKVEESSQDSSPASPIDYSKPLEDSPAQRRSLIMRILGICAALIGSVLCILAGLLSLFLGYAVAKQGGSTLPPGLYWSLGLYFIGKGCVSAGLSFTTGASDRNRF